MACWRGLPPGIPGAEGLADSRETDGSGRGRISKCSECPSPLLRENCGSPTHAPGAKAHAAPRGKARVKGFASYPSSRPSPGPIKKGKVGGVVRRQPSMMPTISLISQKKSRGTHIESRIAGDSGRPRYAAGGLVLYIYKHPLRLRKFSKGKTYPSKKGAQKQARYANGYKKRKSSYK